MSNSPFSQNKAFKVHPVAELFPMMSEEELDETAADIKANGQFHPIILDKDNVLIDGRNRLEACRRAGVEPKFGRLPNGTDPVAFILSNNVAKRHLTKGQKGMAAVMANSLKIKEFGIRQQTAQLVEVNSSYITQAATVLEHAQDLAPLVLAGSMSLGDAYVKAQQAKHSFMTVGENALLQNLIRAKLICTGS